jgi:hypothetical protein
MTTKKTLVLALVLALVTLYITQVLVPSRQAKELETIALRSVARSDIDTVSISRYDQGAKEERFVLMQSLAPRPTKAKDSLEEKVPELVQTWSLPSIRGAILDKNALDTYLTALLEISIEGPLETEQLYRDISVYGLDKPQVTAIVDGNGQRTELAFGKKNEYLGKRYVKVSGRDGVFLVEESSFEQVNKGASDLRSKTPFTFSLSDVREFLATSIQGRIRVTQPEVGAWRIESPESLPASREDVEEMLNTIAQLKVKEFIDGSFEERNRYGFGLPRANVIILFRDGIEPQEVSFFLANASQGDSATSEMYMYSSSSETIFKLATDPSDKLVQTVDGLREKAIVAMPYDQMKGVIAGGEQGQGVTIAVKEIEWVVNDKPSDPVFVEQLLKDISGLRAVDFPLGVSGEVFQKPFLTLDIEPKSGDYQKVSLVVGDEYSDARGNALRYVKNSNNDTIFGIRDVEAKRIVPHEEALVKPLKAPATP